VTGTQANGWTMPDPGYPLPPLNASSQSWSSSSGSVEQPGTYTSDPRPSGCYFLAGGVYNFKAGITENGGFVSNELRPPDEPNMMTAGVPNFTTLRAALTGTNQQQILVNTLPGAVQQNSQVFLEGQLPFTVSANAAAGATVINISKQTIAGTVPNGAVLSIRALPQFWDLNGSCGSSFSAVPNGAGTLNGTESVEVTAVRWEPNGVANCTGPATPTCYLRESAPSMCKTVTLGNGVLKVSATTDPGAQYFNVYIAQNGSCSGFAYLTTFAAGSFANINSSTFPVGWPAGQPSPPDQQGMPLATGLPNANPAPGTPPRGDLANEGHCVDTSTGAGIACPGALTPGAVVIYIPNGGCIDQHGTGDMYLFSGYQYQRVVLYEPGPEQSSQPNTCTGNKVNGAGFTSLIGIFYMPAASVTINGNSAYQATIAGGVIAWTASIIGTGNVAITADPTLRTWPPSVHLTQ
jgi:hypothetical protein